MPSGSAHSLSSEFENDTAWRSLNFTSARRGYSPSTLPFSHGFKYCRHLGDVETHLSSLFDRLDEGVVCQCFTNPTRPQTCWWHIVTSAGEFPLLLAYRVIVIILRWKIIEGWVKEILELNAEAWHGEESVGGLSLWGQVVTVHS